MNIQKTLENHHFIAENHHFQLVIDPVFRPERRHSRSRGRHGHGIGVGVAVVIIVIIVIVLRLRWDTHQIGGIELTEKHIGLNSPYFLCHFVAFFLGESLFLLVHCSISTDTFAAMICHGYGPSPKSNCFSKTLVFAWVIKCPH